MFTPDSTVLLSSIDTTIATVSGDFLVTPHGNVYGYTVTGYGNKWKRLVLQDGSIISCSEDQEFRHCKADGLHWTPAENLQVNDILLRWCFSSDESCLQQITIAEIHDIPPIQPGYSLQSANGLAFVNRMLVRFTE